MKLNWKNFFFFLQDLHSNFLGTQVQMKVLFVFELGGLVLRSWKWRFEALIRNVMSYMHAQHDDALAARKKQVEASVRNTLQPTGPKVRTVRWIKWVICAHIPPYTRIGLIFCIAHPNPNSYTITLSLGLVFAIMSIRRMSYFLPTTVTWMLAGPRTTYNVGLPN